MDNAVQPAYSLDQPQGDGRSFLRRHGRLIVGGALFFGALIYFAWLAFQGSTVYYLTVDELREQGSAAYGVQNRVSGKLVAESFEREPQGTLASFALADEGGSHTLPTQYDGVVPDLFFNEHSEIIAEGSYRPDGVFHADQVIVKCPSKYASQAATETQPDYATLETETS